MNDSLILIYLRRRRDRLKAMMAQLEGRIDSLEGEKAALAALLDLPSGLSGATTPNETNEGDEG